MSLIKTLGDIGKKSLDISPSDYRGVDGNTGFGTQPMHFWDDTTFENGRVFRYENHLSALRAYRRCPPLAAIINRMAQAYINGKTWVMNSAGKEATSPDAKKLRKLFTQPNPLQSWKQFEAQQQIYLDLFGFVLLLPIIPVGFEQYGPIEATSMWNIPPNMLNIEETNKLFYQTDVKGIIKSIKLNYKGNNTFLDINNLYIFKDFIPSADTLVFPESRICSLEMPISNIVGSYESRGILINNRGALGAFTQEPNRGQYVNAIVTPEMKANLQRDFMRYGLRNGQWKFIFSEASLKWQQIGIPTRDLMLFEEIEDDIMRICDAYGYPSPLINSEKGPAVANTKEYKAQLYQDAIIPKSASCYEQWNQVFTTGERNLRIDKDYSHIPVLQEDAKTLWDARNSRVDSLLKEWKNDMITRNRFLFLNGEDTLGPEGDIYFSQYNVQPQEQSPQPAADA